MSRDPQWSMAQSHWDLRFSSRWNRARDSEGIGPVSVSPLPRPTTMKIFSPSPLDIWSRLILLIAAAILPANVWAVPLPAAAALPLGSSTTRGFIVRTVQAPTGEIVENSLLRAVRQINGTLPDSLGGVMANDAIAGPGAGGSYTVPTSISNSTRHPSISRTRSEDSSPALPPTFSRASPATADSSKISRSK